MAAGGMAEIEVMANGIDWERNALYRRTDFSLSELD